MWDTSLRGQYLFWKQGKPDKLRLKEHLKSLTPQIYLEGLLKKGRFVDTLIYIIYVTRYKEFELQTVV